MRIKTQHETIEAGSAERLDRMTGIHGLGALVESLAPGPYARTPERCPHCGWTEARIKDEGLVGCPLCYSIFEKAIRAL